MRLRFRITITLLILHSQRLFNFRATLHFGKIDDVGNNCLQFLVGWIKEAVIISIIITVACCLHAGQSFLYFRGGHVEDALTCFVRVVVGTMDEANIMQQQQQHRHSRKHQMTETGKTLE